MAERTDRVSTRQVCEAVDGYAIGERFTMQNIVDKTGASKSGSSAILTSLVGKGVLERYNEKQFTVARLRSAVEACDAGELKGAYGRGAVPSEPPPPSEPEDLSVEIDPMDIFSEMSPEDIGACLSLYIKTKNSEAEPLRESLNEKQLIIERVYRQMAEQKSMYEGQIASLRDELKDARVEAQAAKGQLTLEKYKVHPPEKIKVVHTVSGKQAAPAHGGHGGYKYQPVVLHRPPRTEHAPKPVVEHVQKRIKE